MASKAGQFRTDVSRPRMCTRETMRRPKRVCNRQQGSSSRTNPGTERALFIGLLVEGAVGLWVGHDGRLD
jgi:hypothetical protein